MDRIDARGAIPQPVTESIIAQHHRAAVETYLDAMCIQPLLLLGDAAVLLEQFPESCIDVVMTSPPYWRKRDDADSGIGMESDYRCSIENLTRICLHIKRVLKPGGSFWLNLGDTYHHGCLVGIPWRVACALTDHQRWILRNSVIWNTVKSGMDSATNRPGNVHEYVFHFVKQSTYSSNVDAIRSTPRKAKIVNGAVVSATGVSSVRRRRQIERSTALSEEEKRAALKELDEMLESVAAGRIADFRMILRGQHRVTHSDRERVSGRARAINKKGFYFLRYHPNGSKPVDVWDILPEDSQRRDRHFAPYPVELCRIPLLATRPEDGVALDPFCGTGTTLVAARELGRRSIGIDISPRYLDDALRRCQALR